MSDAPSKADLIRVLHEAGMAVKDIASLLDCTKSYVYQFRSAEAKQKYKASRKRWLVKSVDHRRKRHRDYQRKRYQTDPEYREKIRARNKERAREKMASDPAWVERKRTAAREHWHRTKGQGCRDTTEGT